MKKLSVLASTSLIFHMYIYRNNIYPAFIVFDAYLECTEYSKILINIYFTIFRLCRRIERYGITNLLACNKNTPTMITLNNLISWYLYCPIYYISRAFCPMDV